ncbi:Rpp14/Pop5 family protein [Nanoarchaeota archaeon]
MLPCLRERKRYLAFEIISDKPIEDSMVVNTAIFGKALEFLGELGCAEAGMIFLDEKYNQEKQRGLIRVNNKSLDKLRATLALVEQIDNQKVIVRSVGASGILKKAEGKYLAA